MNLKTNNGKITVNKKKYYIKAEVIPENETENYWSKLIDIYPTFNIYRLRTKRKIPLVKLIKI